MISDTIIFGKVDGLIKKLSDGKYSASDIPLLWDRVMETETLIHESHAQTEELSDKISVLITEVRRVRQSQGGILKKIREMEASNETNRSSDG